MGSDGQAAAALQAHWHQRGEERRPPHVDAALGATEARAARMASRAAAREVRNAQLPWRDEIERLVTRDFGETEESARLTEVFSAALTEGTVENYSRHFARFAEWCELQSDRPCPLPATTDTVLRWLAGDVCKEDRVKAGSLQPYLSAINTMPTLRCPSLPWGGASGASSVGLAISLRAGAGQLGRTCLHR